MRKQATDANMSRAAAPSSPSPPHWGGEGRGEVGNARSCRSSMFVMVRTRALRVEPMAGNGYSGGATHLTPTLSPLKKGGEGVCGRITRKTAP